MFSKKEILEAFVEAQTEGVWPRKIAVGSLLHDARFRPAFQKRWDSAASRLKRPDGFIIEPISRRDFQCLACERGIWQIREGHEQYAIHVGIGCVFTYKRHKTFEVVEGLVYGRAS